mmetsp:Transcript_8040/g.17441  ORF Transcript_8040/g.17441 Transcript_8040/m.17441 type:complete len:179 (-) Transcript_8040:92-628(-)
MPRASSKRCSVQGLLVLAATVTVLSVDRRSGSWAFLPSFPLASARGAPAYGSSDATQEVPAAQGREMPRRSVIPGLAAGGLFAAVLALGSREARADAKFTYEKDTGDADYGFTGGALDKLTNNYSKVKPVCEEFDAIVNGGSKTAQEQVAKRVRCELPEDKEKRVAAANEAASKTSGK